MDKQEMIPKNRLREVRLSQALSQGELAERAGVSRQTVGGIETGQYGPSLAVALRLARVLGKPLEDVFWLPEEPVREVTAGWAGIGEVPDSGKRIRVIRAPAGYAAYPTSREMFAPEANAQVIQKECDRLRARVLVPETLEKRAIIMAGCSPVLGLLQHRLQQRFRDTAFHWINTNSMKSLEALKHGYVQIAGVHILDESTGEYNLPVIRRVLEEQKYAVFNLYHGEQGFLLPKNNPKGISGFGDLSRGNIRVVNREAGAESRRILDAGLRSEAIDPRVVPGYHFQVGTHHEIAQTVLWGGADCGVSLRPVAEFFSLNFLPLTQERYDLVILRDYLQEPGIQAILEYIQKENFLLELESSGYEPVATGREIFVTS